MTEYRVFRMDVWRQFTLPSLSGSFRCTRAFGFGGSGVTPDLLHETTLIFLLPENPESLVVSRLTHSGACCVGGPVDRNASFVRTSGTMFSASARDLLVAENRRGFWSSDEVVGVVRRAMVAVFGRLRRTLERFGEEEEAFLVGGEEAVVTVVQMEVLETLSWSARYLRETDIRVR